MSPQDRVIGVDLGGTKILAGLVDRSGRVDQSRKRATPTGSQDELLAGVEGAVEDLLADGVVALGFAIPSRVDQRAGRAWGSVNIPLREVAFRDRMEERFGLPVALDNDANAAAFAEWTCGAGEDARTLVMLTLGTGVGGGFVLAGRLYRGWAEAGHMVVVHDGERCPGNCTGRGHLEAYCTGVAADKAAQEAFGADADARRLVSLADDENEQAREILAGIGRILGSGVGSLVNLFAAERVVIGGGFGTGAFEHLVGPALEVARREALSPADEELEIVRAELGDEAGLIGAGLLAFEAGE